MIFNPYLYILLSLFSRIESFRIQPSPGGRGLQESLTSPVSTTLGDNLPRRECQRLCDKPMMDAIAPLNVDGDKQFYVIIIRDAVCSWLLDLNHPNRNREYGRLHFFKYPRLQAMFTIFDDPTSSKQFNLTALFSSGMVGEVWRSVDGVINRQSDGPLPLKGLGHNMMKPIDDAFGLQSDSSSRTVRIIQGDFSMTYDLSAMKKISGPDKLLKDYSYDVNKFGPISAVFRRKNDIYFLTDSYYYIWKSKDGKTGVLGDRLSITKDLYKCKEVFNFSVSVSKEPIIVKPSKRLGTPIPMSDINDEDQDVSNLNSSLSSESIDSSENSDTDVTKDTNESIDDITTLITNSDDVLSEDTNDYSDSLITEDQESRTTVGLNSKDVIQTKRSTAPEGLPGQPSNEPDLTEAEKNSETSDSGDVKSGDENGSTPMTKPTTKASKAKVTKAKEAGAEDPKTNGKNRISVSLLFLIALISMSVSAQINNS